MNEPPRITIYSKLRVSHVRLNLVKGASEDWARNLVESIIERKPGGLIRCAPPPGWAGEAAVKVYGRRPKHNLLRLLRASRTVLEAAGYLAFTERGLAVPRLILWGEARRWGLFEFGIVATLWVDAPSVAEIYAATGQDELLFATAEELAVIHKAGLTHGDPYARNFLATRPRPIPLDLASWGRFGKASQTKDLIRFACSLIKMTDDLDQTKAVLLHYEKFGLPLPVSVNEVIDRAIALTKVKKIRA